MADKPREKPPAEGELGTVLAYTDSLFLDYLDPTTGSTSVWEARDMAQMLRTESQARKVEALLTLPILSAPHKIEPAKGDKGEAEAITEWLTAPDSNGGMSTPLKLVVAQATTAITYRVASFEQVWQTSARFKTPKGSPAHVFDKIAFRPATNTRVRRDRKNGAYRGLEQDAPYGGLNPTRIKPEKAWTYVHGQHRSPVLGTSDMEIPLVCWRAKQKLRFLWFLYLELHAQPRTAFSDTREQGGDHGNTKAAAKMWSKLRGGGAIALPPGVQGNVLETAGQAAEQFQQAMKYLDSEMTGQVLAQFADLASAAADGKGSLALSRDQSDLFMQTRRWSADELADSFTHYNLGPLVRHNFGPDAAVPRLTIGPLVTPDLAQMLGALKDFGAQSMPAEFVAFLVEQTAAALGMKPDRAAQLVKATTAAHEKAARTAQQQRVAQVTGPLAAAQQIVDKAAQQDGETRGAAARAAAAAG